MDPRHYHRGPLGSFLAIVALSVTAAPACTAPSNDDLPGDPPRREVESATQQLSTQASSAKFTAFESGQVRPLALSPDKQLLFAVNTPDNRLEVFRIKKSQLIRAASIPVGLEPVAVAARTNREVWVVNHLSDSVSIVQLDDTATSGSVQRTLLVGDEPRDIVFAGPSRKRAFITAAHRGQNISFDPQLTTPGVGRADVWVFDATALGTSLGGTPLTVVPLFTDTPRALAVTPDGSRVYAAGFHTGNRTTSISEPMLPDGFGPDGAPGPSASAQGDPAPEVGTIVKWDGAHWRDALGRTRDELVKLSLPDKDVFVLDATANPPRQVAGTGGFFQGVGTILYSMAVNPVTGKVYVANTEANNHDRFEGPGTFTGQTVRGRFHENRITVLTPGTGGVAPRHLNKHIDYDTCCAPIPNAENARSLALPQGMAVSSTGATLYVAALGSDKVGIFSTTQLETDTFVPSTASQVRVSGGGPTGVLLDEDRTQLLVLTRFDNAISIIDTVTRIETAHVKLHNPEPQSVVAGRRFLYDAALSSSHGDSSCASCHVFGDFDSLAWDLGNPDGEMLTNPGPFASVLFNLITGQPMDPVFHPMKGPMTTQSLRGMANHGPMHWRGDRTGGNDASTAQPNSGTFDEHAGFMKFQGAFADLLGRHAPLPEASMNAFTAFILQVAYPPNPIRPLDNSLTPDQDAGRQLFSSVNCGIPACFDGTCPTLTCNSCHTLDPGGNPGTEAPGFFGTSGFSAFAFNPQLFKVPHLRNLYQKLGMFGNAYNPGFLPGDNDHQGDQVRGFGYLHDGGTDTVFRFMHGISFADTEGTGNGGIPTTPQGEVMRRQLEAFVLAFPTNLAPIVGQQITAFPGSPAAVGARIDLLRQRAEAGECELTVKTLYSGVETGLLYTGAGSYARDQRALAAVSDASLRYWGANGSPVTYTCVPPGSGERIAVDRDGDGVWDGDERAAGTDPADPTSKP
jgi:DNA-binding beta-propeller fold protein YncE